MRSLFFVLISLPLFLACGPGKSGKTSTGMKYVLYQNNGGDKVMPDDLLYLRYAMYADDSLMTSNYAEPLPEVGFYPDAAKEGRKLSPIEEAFGLLEVGDSIRLSIPIDSMGTPGMRPPGMEKTRFIVYHIKLEKRISKKELSRLTEEVASKVADLYRKSVVDSLVYNETSSGLRYAMLEEGMGGRIKKGDKVLAQYYGVLAKDGQMFDNSFERGMLPFSFTAMEGQVIPGWDEAALLLKKGSKVFLYIPSSLAYGDNGAGSIGPNEDLMFYLEISDVE